MSRMTKYLKQKCTLRAVKRVNGVVVMNEYGEPEYTAEVVIPCRREKYSRDIETSTGAIVRSSTQYYTVKEIGINDLLDGDPVLSLEEYTNSLGLTEGYRSVT